MDLNINQNSPDKIQNFGGFGGGDVRESLLSRNNEMDLNINQAVSPVIQNTSNIFQEITIPTSEISKMSITNFNEFFERTNFQSIQPNWDEVGEVYTKTIEVLGVLVAAAGWAFDFVKFDIFRDFFQIIGLFFSGIAWPKGFGVVWGKITGVVSIDLSFIHVTPLVWFWILWVICAILFVLFRVRLRKDPAALLDGHEARTWTDRSKLELLWITALVTLLISLYLPMSRSALQVIVCYSPDHTYYDKNSDESKESYKSQFEDKGGCWHAVHIVHIIFAILIMLVITIYFPILTLKLIQRNKPQPRLFDQEGQEKAYTDVEYRRDLDKDKCPYKFVYKGYERKWSGYKSIIMAIKLLLIVVVIAFTSQIAQISVVLGIVSLFALISFLSAPFIDNKDDKIDQSARITTVVTVIFGLILATKYTDSSAPSAYSIILNILHALNIFLMVLLTIASFKFCQRKWKNCTGRVDFSQKNFDYNLAKERKLRIWHPFWESLMSHQENLIPAYERLKKMKEIASYHGYEEYKSALIPPDEEIVRERVWIQSAIEGVDGFWDGVDENNEFKSKTCFGKIWIDPFPFKCTIVYDDAGPAVIPEQIFVSFCRRNREEDVLKKRKIRQKLRALNGETVFFEYVETHSKSKKGFEDENKKSSVKFTFKYGVLTVKANRDVDWAAGFNVSISYTDGVGDDDSGESFKGEKTTIGHNEIGIRDDFTYTPELKRLLKHPENKKLIQQNLPSFLDESQAYRDGLVEERVQQETILSNGFWLFVFNNDRITRENLTIYLQEHESDEAISRIPEVHEEGLNYLYSKLAFYDSHPAVALWYVFWDDFYQNNGWMKKFKGFDAILNPRFPSAICYHPQDRDNLEQFLEENGLKKKIKKKYLNKLYEKLEDYSEGSLYQDKIKVVLPGPEYITGRDLMAGGRGVISDKEDINLDL
ncbi:g protein-coupled receptor-related [Anaeramoeba ignava]|uniref:G protein-coupled receptor-related n=1 Tax=Anaeramoeba ignava TaxID=1746090 RepID=A0A9Q0LT41_ANAIG|nr:g protein-coupled receptor-related [Anaeramoeba ignava]